MLICWQGVSLFEVATKKTLCHIGIYHINKQTAIDLKNKTQLIFTDSTSLSNYNYHIKNNHAFYNYPQTNRVNYDYVKSKNVSLLKVSASNHQYLIKFLKPDYLLITNNTELCENYLKASKIKLLIADGSNNYKVIKELRLLCDKFGIPFYSTSDKGYLQIKV